MAYFLQQVLNGLHSAALYALLAYGYALVFGVTRRANFTHGALFAFAGQLLILGTVFGYRQLTLTLPAGLVFGAVVSIIFAATAARMVARRVFLPLSGVAPNAFLAATLAVMIVLLELGRLAADTRDWWLPPILATPVVFANIAGFAVSLTRLQVIDIAAALAALAGAHAIIARTHFGRIWRATCDDATAAALVGVDPARALVATVLAGTALAALAGMMAALHFGNVDFGTGMVFGLKTIFVAALGGSGRPAMAALGGAAIGLAEAQWTAWFDADWRDAAVLGGLSLLLILRPAVASERQW